MINAIRIAALVCAGLIVILLPAGYFAVAFSAQRAVLSTEAEINARLITQLINANPDLWEFEQARIESILERRPRDGTLETRRAVNAAGKQIAVRADQIDPPYIEESAALFDSGRVVGRFVVVRSLKPVLERTALVGLLGLAIAAIGLAFVLLGPLRSLRRANAALGAEQMRAIELRLAKGALESGVRYIWQLEPEGLCRDEICIPLAPIVRGDLVVAAADGLPARINLTGLWRRLGHPVARDATGDTWVLGTGAAQRAQALQSLDAPDFSLPDLEGHTHSLHQHRGKKVFLATWASW